MEEPPGQVSADGVPLFPLPNCVLFPRVILPLQVFEPRYCSMVEELVTLPESRQILAVALLRPGHDDLYHTKTAPIFPVVCTGKVVRWERVDDGRYAILVLGLDRATVVAENRARPYRRVHLAPALPPARLGEKEEMELVNRVARVLCQAVREGLVEKSVIDQLTRPAADLSHLVDILSFHLIPSSDSCIKQRVLEEPDVRLRAEIVGQWLSEQINLLKRCRERPWPPPLSLN
ncbi:MAG: hypothetical protein C4547_12925 [Phycisphaerales bacterium]|nr:MAG: hypothetical protein C4547_12925 [Phycisphaerales bacterium]